MKHMFLTFVALFSSVICSGCGYKSFTSSYTYNKDKIRINYGNSDLEFSPDNNYIYTLQNTFEQSPNTFEAWIKIPKASLGGIIMGNAKSTARASSDVDWGVDAVGRPFIEWFPNNEFSYTFPKVYLNDDIWHHLSFVRDPDAHKFFCYVDGEEVGSIKSRTAELNSKYPFMIGSDARSTSNLKRYFDGYIKEIAIYKDPLPASRIKEDYRYGVIDTYGDSLLGDWYLGEQWKNILVTEKFYGENNMYLSSFEKYVPTVPTGDFDYTLTVLPDIQTMTDFPKSNWQSDNNYYRMMNWIAENIETENMKFCFQVGDLVDNGNDDVQWERARNGFDFWDGDLPYSIVPGNHDYDDNCSKTRDTEYMNAYFPVEDAMEFDEFGGVYEEGHIENAYYLFEAEGIKYVSIALEIFPRMEVIRWAGRICEAFPERRVIITTHSYMTPDAIISDKKGETYAFRNYVECQSGKELYEGVVKRYKNVFMVLCGHCFTDDLIIRKDIGDNGNPILTLLVDLQCCNYGGKISWTINPIDAFLLMKFNEAKKELYLRYYSPKYDSNWNIQNQLTVDFSDWQDPKVA